MALLRILEFPDPVLKEKARPLDGINPAIEKLIRDMTDTMYQAPGVGLAANQVGALKQVLVADVSSAEEARNTIVIVNPRIIELSDETETAEEGCLSVPEFRAEVERAVRIVVLGKDLQGEEVEITAEGFFARVLQHEIDHLHGTLYIDHIGKLKRQRYVRQRKKALAANKE
ncbi:MAG TPA: peptide deformylase [bacterium]|nr:peptide deformylase [bacterium]